MVTLNDIASELNIHKSTVSKALRSSSDINPETRAKVVEKAREMGYVMKKKTCVESSRIVIICPEVTSFHYSQLVTEIHNRLLEKGYQALTMLSNFSCEKENEFLSSLTSDSVSGIILVTERDSSKNPVPTTTIPLVIIGLNYESENHDVISIDERRGIRAVVNHLIGQGHRKIAFLGDQYVSQRLSYLREFLSLADVELPAEYVVLTKTRGENSGYIGAKRLMCLQDPPTAIVAGYDAVALGAYRLLCESGISLSDDVALIGFDDASFCPYLPVSLTSVSYDVAAEGRIAVAILLSHVNGESSTAVQSVVVVPKLIIRESSAKNMRKSR